MRPPRTGPGPDSVRNRSRSSRTSIEREQPASLSADGRTQQGSAVREKKALDSDEISAVWKSSGSNLSSWRLGNLGVLSGSSMTHRLADMGRSLLASMSPIPVESSFIEKGTLTPQEFVDAGDQLSFKFPTWQWQGSPDGQRKCSSWLPAQKQYLLSRSVPCYRRVREMDQALLYQESDTGWLLPLFLENDDQQEKGGLLELSEAAGEHVLGGRTVDYKNSSTQSQAAFRSTDFSRPAQRGRPALAVATTHTASLADPLSKENVIPDISSLADIDDLVQEEEDPVVATAPAYFVRNAPDAEIVAARTYDLSITYDKYFQTPRIWLFGYNENGVPLSPEEIFEDILTEYAAKTVTVDPHPCTGIPTASIHPCRHASVMKKIVDSWLERGMKPRHDLALLALLKFISSVMPTIEYDFTMDIDMFIHTLADEALK